MNPKRILLIFVCVLLALTPLACGQTTETVEPTRSLPSRTSLPPRPTRTPVNPVNQPTRPQPTNVPPVLPTQRPTSDPNTTLYERDYGSEGKAFEDAFITPYGQAIVVLLVLDGALQYQVINLEDGWEATFDNPLQYTLAPGDISVQKDKIILAEYEVHGSGNITIWSVTPGNAAEKIATITQPDATLISLALSPDGKTVAAGFADGIIRTYRTEGGALQKTIQAQVGWVMSLSYSWDGRYLLSDGESFDPNTYVYNASSGSRLATLSEESWNPERPAFSPDGSLVAAVSDSGTLIYTTNNWQPNGTMLTGVWGGTFTCDSTAFMMDTRAQTEIYSIETGELTRTLDYGGLYCLSDGRTVVIDLDYDNYILTVRLVNP